MDSEAIDRMEKVIKTILIAKLEYKFTLCMEQEKLHRQVNFRV